MSVSSSSPGKYLGEGDICEVTYCELGGQENVIPLPSSGEPLPNEILAVLVDVCRVPEGLPQLVCTI